MTIWTWPFDSIPEMRSFRLRSFNVSAITSQNQELISGGLMVQRFEARMTFSEMAEERWRDLDGLLAELSGTGGRLRLWDHAREEPYYNTIVQKTSATFDGGATFSNGSGFVSGALPPFVVVAENAVRGATNLKLRGFPASLSGVLRRGDLFEARPNGIPADHGHLYNVTRWSNSNSEGLSRVYFKPGLRKGLRAGDMIVLGGGTFRPSSVFRLASDEEGDIEVSAPFNGSMGVTLIEVLVPSV